MAVDPQRYFGTVTLEIQARVPAGIPADRRKIVQENSDALKFDQSDFAES